MKETKYFQDIFPHNKMRESQEDGIPKVYNHLKNNKWVLLEGATGTGKTILTLSSLLKLIEDTKYERIMVVTNVKQQQNIFENEIKKININTDKNINSVTLKGKNELCTFVESGEIGENEIYSKCDELRKGTSQIKEIEGTYDTMLGKSKSGDEYLYSNNDIPNYMNTQYCPFYANFLKNSQKDAMFKKEFNGQLTTEDILKKSGKKGLCPHATAGKIMNDADVIIGNYNHILDEKTVNNYTNEIIDENTILLVDEAHNIIEKARDNLSESIHLKDIKKCIQETLSMEIFLKLPSISKMDNKKLKRIEKRSIISFGNSNELQKNSEELKNMINMSNYSVKDIARCKEFMKDFLETVEKLIENGDSEKIPLRDPEKLEQDRISDWISLYFSSKKSNIKDIIQAKELLLQMLTQSYMNSSKVGRIPSEFAVEKVFNFLDLWVNEDQIDYYRSIETKENKNYSKLKLYNLVPKKQLSEKFDEFGVGVLMSATLEPMDEFSDEVGLSNFEELSYGLNFPEENRCSLSVQLPKYTSSNRKYKKNRLKDNSIVRRKYINAVKRVVKNCKGNTMITMPSYSEASWMSDFLIRDNDINKKILIDDSEKNVKEEFFENKDSILLTSARGTLTEGVDYKGKKLKNMIVVGLPIVNTQDIYSKAILTSYKEKFSRYKGFQMAFILPATRKTRQSIGRVIRSKDDTGTRVLIDERYCENGSVRKYMGSDKEELQDVYPDELDIIINSFWS